MENNMTALVSAFVRAYHYKNSDIKIYDDKNCDKILSNDEYLNIKNNMAKGIKYFNPNFNGSEDEAIKWIVNKQIGPSVLGRSAFNKKMLDNAIKFGCEQYLIYASGYDTSSLNYNIKCFEIDKEDIIEDKLCRLKLNNVGINNINYIKTDFTKTDWIDDVLKAPYDKTKISFNSLLGISYYLDKNDFKNMIYQISNIICKGSSLLFDFQTNIESKETKINEQLASGASEPMKAKYDYDEISKLLLDNNFQIYEYLNDEDITSEFFRDYNISNSNNKIIAPKGVAYLLAVKK
ncbi:MAG: class I SAM-dependent methyltransferase [Bacilli bacterium]